MQDASYIQDCMQS